MADLPVASRILDEVQVATRGTERPGLFFIQHILQDTETFLRLLLERRWRVRVLIGIPYSCDGAAAERLARGEKIQELHGSHNTFVDGDRPSP